MRLSHFFGLVVSCLVASCSADDSDIVQEILATDPGSGCAEGFVPFEDGSGCHAIVPASTCASGTRAALGKTACEPVGVTSCAEGFVPHASGWGCDVVIPKTACLGATRERIGSDICVPVGDCNGPFPPSNATHFVKASYGDAELDAHHFRTIQEALIAAESKAVIAVEEGTYGTGTLRPKKPVSIVGRCAEKVILQPVAALDGAIFPKHVDGVHVENLTLRGFDGALRIVGGSATLDRLVIENGVSAGITALLSTVTITNVVVRGTRAAPGSGAPIAVGAGSGAKVDIVDSAFSDNEVVGIYASGADTHLRFARSVVRDGRPLNGAFGIGVNIATDATVEIEESALVDNASAGVSVGAVDHAGTAIVRRSVIRGTKMDTVSKTGDGISASSKLVVEETTISDSALVDIVVPKEGGAQLTRTTLLGTSSLDPRSLGPVGLQVVGSATATSLAIVGVRTGSQIQSTGTAKLEKSLVAKTRDADAYYQDGNYAGVGVFVESKALLDLVDSTIDGTRTIGLGVLGRANVEGVLVLRTRAARDGLGGRGVSVHNAGRVSLLRSAVLDNAESGVALFTGAPTLEMSDSTVEQTDVDPSGSYGIGVLFSDGAIGTIASSTVTSSKGIGVAVAAAGASITSSFLSRNSVAVHAQAGTSLIEGDATGDPLTFAVSSDTVFFENGARVGGGEVPLPMVLGPPAAVR